MTLFKERVISEESTSTRNYLDIVSEVIANDMLSKNLVNVHRFIDRVVDRHSDWQSIVITNAKASIIYPLEHEGLESDIQEADMVVSITTEDQFLGKIYLRLNKDYLINKANRVVRNIELMVVFVLL